MAARPRISIVDDDESIREALKSLVRSLGYDAETYESADTFLRSKSLSEIACVITDVQMIERSGFDLRDRLRAAGYQTPIIFITAHPDMLATAWTECADAIGCLKKPFNDKELIALMDRALAAA